MLDIRIIIWHNHTHRRNLRERWLWEWKKGKEIKNILFNPKKERKKEMETLNVVMAIVGNLLVVGAFVWFIIKRDKK